MRGCCNGIGPASAGTAWICVLLKSNVLLRRECGEVRLVCRYPGILPDQFTGFKSVPFWLRQKVGLGADDNTELAVDGCMAGAL